MKIIYSALLALSLLLLPAAPEAQAGSSTSRSYCREGYSGNTTTCKYRDDHGRYQGTSTCREDSFGTTTCKYRDNHGRSQGTSRCREDSFGNTTCRHTKY
ncbi:MAG: hypothetical protein LBE49_01410 [Deltaproteobacteria bacterium]|jgi:hypothetical protein|nr:hypothetical protein [Deltaproteobacteria bacterium]